MTRVARKTLSAGLVLAAAAVASQAEAAVIYLNMADINPAIGGIMGFNGVAMQDIGGMDDLRVSIGALVFNNAQFDITSGWTVTSTLITDRDSSGTVTTGDSITANISNGTFRMVNPSGELVLGSFNNAVLNTSVGSSTININTGNANGLNLTPGAVLTALNYPAFDPAESLAVSVVGIDAPGVQVAPGALPVPGLPFFTGAMLPFGLGQNVPTSGSVDMVADLVPEPASAGLAGLAALGLVARRRRDVAKKLMALSLVAGGVLAVSGTSAQAAIVNMNLSDINAPIAGVAGFDGSNIVDLGGIDTFVLSGGYPSFPNASLDITSGFNVTNVVVVDGNLNGTADAGELVTANVGGGTFAIVNPGGVIVSGSFSSASLSTSVGSSSVTINASDANFLNLFAGPLLNAAGILDLGEPESFSINIVGITAPPGVQVLGTAVIVPGFLSGSIAPFGVGQLPPTSGSVNLVADAIIPEPATLGLLSVGALGLIARRRRHA